MPVTPSRQRSPSTLAGRLRWARDLADISSRQLDELAHITVGHTSHIESGRRTNIESKTALALARVLGLSLDWLLRGEGDLPDIHVVRSAVQRAGGTPRSATGTDGS